jgi:hypothetical protein
LIETLEDLAADLRRDEDERQPQQHERVEPVAAAFAAAGHVPGRRRDRSADGQEQPAERGERRRRREPRRFYQAPLHLIPKGERSRRATPGVRLTRRGRLP